MINKDKTQKGTLPEHELDELLEFMKDNPWKAAFEKLNLPVLKSKKEWFSDTKRGAYYNQLDLGRKETALDVGAGAGVISHALAETFENVYSLEYNPKWVEFLSKRFKQDKIANVNLVRANATAFPFKPDSFDLVVVNGVLEWVADFSLQGYTTEVQLKFLSDIHKLIRPGGKIGIAIENRYYLRWFLGESPHGEPPYVVLMPRFLAGYIYRKKLNKEYRNYIYGFWGYKRLLNRAGFKNLNIQLAVPNYYNPLFTVGLDKKSQKKHFEKFSIQSSKNVYLQKIVRFLLQIGVLGYCEHSFYISAEK